MELVLHNNGRLEYAYIPRGLRIRAMGENVVIKNCIFEKRTRV